MQDRKDVEKAVRAHRELDQAVATLRFVVDDKAQLRSMVLPTDRPVTERAAAVACADVVLSSCPLTQLIATYCGLPLVALGAQADQLPQRDVIRRLESEDLSTLSVSDVMQALGF